MTTTIRQEQRQQEQAAMAALEAYIDGRMPAHLKPGAPVPATWPFGDQTWEQFREATAKLYRIEARRDFVAAFTKGWTLPELLGDRDYRQEVRARDGSPVRPLVSSVPSHLLRQADQALRELNSRGLERKLDDLSMFALERAVDSSAEKVEGAIHEATALCNGFDLERRAQAADGVAIVVRQPFTAKGGSHFTPEVRRVSHEDAKMLRQWQIEAEAQAALHNWEAPHGLTRETWPPFTLEGETGPTTDALWGEAP